MSTVARPPFRADHVGSLLRPPDLHEARARAARGEIDRAALRAVEDRSIRGAVALQESVGLQSVTDGEFRRDWWHIDFIRGFDGVETSTQSFGVKFEGADEQPPLMKVTGKIRRSRPSMLDHFTFLKSATTRTAKFCLPSPVMLHARGDRPTLKATYPDLDEFWADLTAAYREEIRALCAAASSRFGSCRRGRRWCSGSSARRFPSSRRRTTSSDASRPRRSTCRSRTSA